MTIENLEEYFDEEIPDEVLNDESWEPRLLAIPEQLGERFIKFEDLIKTEADNV